MKVHFEYNRGLGKLPVTLEVQNFAIKLSVRLVEKIFEAIKKDASSLFNTESEIDCYYADRHVGFKIGNEENDISIKFTVTADDFEKVYKYVKKEEIKYIN